MAWNAVIDTIADGGSVAEGVQEVPHNGNIQTTSDAIQYTSSALDRGYWYHDYIIIVDRKGWKATDDDGVLVVNMNFEGEIDGARMPTCESAISIVSMRIGNTDWQEAIAACRSKYKWISENHFAVYVDSSIDDVEDALDFSIPLIDGGFWGRKAQQGSICCAAREERPADVQEISQYHGTVAERLGCNNRLGCFVEMENWSLNDPRVRVFQLDERCGVDSFVVDVELAGEVLGSVAMGLRGWAEEKSKCIE